MVAAKQGEPHLMASFALLFSILATGSCSSQVALVMWSSGGDPIPPLAPPLAGQIMSSGRWLSYLGSALGPGPHNVLLFLQEKLSKEDFTRYGGVFGNQQDGVFPNLQAALAASPGQVVVPALAQPGSQALPGLLQETLGVTPLLTDPDSLEHLQLNTSTSNLLIINLPYSTGPSTSCKQILQTNDKVIGEVLSSMTARGLSYTAIYTGLGPSRVIEEESVNGQFKGRGLLQSPTETPTPGRAPLRFNATDGNACILLWAENLNVSPGGGAWHDLAPLSPDMTGSTCNDTNSQLVLTYTAPALTLTFSMSQRNYPVSARHWFTLDTVTLTSANGTASFNGSRGIYAPAEYSFRCGAVRSFQSPLLVPTAGSQGWALNFIDLQIQGFGIANGTGDFSYASDCAGFFTAGIWMGLITSLLLLLILTYGLHMIMQVRTMDRFDDPKGPSISVPQSE